MRPFSKVTAQKKKSGFTMIELILVGAIVITMGMLYMQSQVREQNITSARNIGKQMVDLNAALNAYIVSRYGNVGTLQPIKNAGGTNIVDATGSVVAAGDNLDPGPRTCVNVNTGLTNIPSNTSLRYCDITIQTLINEGLVPPNFTSLPPFRSAGGLDGYMISLRVTSGPVSTNWTTAMGAPNIEAMVQTRNAWLNGTKVDYNLIGEVVRTIGPDGGAVGISRNAAGTMAGYLGGWNIPTQAGTTANAGTAYNFGTVGRFGIRAGFGSSQFLQFLRRDGTLPMTGNLNMGGKSLINASGVSTVDPTDPNTDPNAKCKVTELTSTGALVVRQRSGATCTDTAFMSAQDRPDLVDSAKKVAISTASGKKAKFNGPVILDSINNIYLSNPSSGTGSNGEKNVVPLAAYMSSYVLHDVIMVQDGEAVAKPAANVCANIGGVPKIILTPALTQANIGYVTQGPASLFIHLYRSNGIFVYAQDAGASWIAKVQGWPTADAGGNTPPGIALAQVYCAFPALENKTPVERP